MVAICLLVVSGIESATAIERVGKARGCSVPETPEQRRWITDFAKTLVTGTSAVEAGLALGQNASAEAGGPTASDSAWTWGYFFAAPDKVSVEKLFGTRKQ